MSHEYFQSFQRPECIEPVRLHKPLWHPLNAGPTSNYNDVAVLMNILDF